MKRAVLTIFLQSFTILLIATGLLCTSAIASPEEEDFDSAFRSTSIPWFDSQASEMKAPKSPDQNQSAVADRNRVPPKKVKKKKGQAIIKPKTATGGPGGGGAGGTSAVGDFGNAFMYIAGIILVAALVGLLLYGFLKLESGGTDLPDEESKRKRKIRDHVKHLPFELEEEEGDFETFADRAYREGNYSKSVIYLFADLLVAMNEAGVLRLQRGKTNRQYLNEIWDYQDVRPYYRNVMTAFEDAFFGQHEISMSRAEECFAARPAFDAAIEKIRQQKFAAASNNQPSLTTPSIPLEGVT